MNRVFVGDCRVVMRDLIAQGVRAQMCVTSPPYYGLRDYGCDGQLGLEATPDAYINNLVEVFRGVRDVLADDGVLWLNIGDSYAMSTKGSSGKGAKQISNAGTLLTDRSSKIPAGLKAKDLIGIPWMLAFALRADGWYLRQDIIWAKPNPMPESVTDRCTKSHEYLFMLAKRERYYYDADAIKEPGTYAGPNGQQHSPYGQGFSRRSKAEEQARQDKQRGHGRRHAGFNDRWDALSKAEQSDLMRNKRSVWTVSPQPYSEAHFATFPPALIAPCVLAGSRAGDIVFDPFFGSGTTGEVAERLGRQWLGIELNPAYVPLQQRRTAQQAFAL
jgi:DNA modification methylase